MQLKLFVIHLPVGVMIVTLILFSQVFTALASLSSSDQADKELKDEDIKQELVSGDTNLNEDNTEKQEEVVQESNGDARERGLEQNITIDDIHSSDDIPFELPFDNIIPFP
jgi:hypothetical protein